MSSCTNDCPSESCIISAQERRRQIPTCVNYFQNNINEVTSFPSLLYVDTLDLTQNILNSFPDLSPIKGVLQRLILNFNYITTVPAAMLDGFAVLRELKLNKNYVSSIPDVNIPMESLELMFNNLTLFPHLPKMGAKLKWLFVAGNPLNLVPEEDLLLMPEIILLHIGL